MRLKKLYEGVDVAPTGINFYLTNNQIMRKIWTLFALLAFSASFVQAQAPGPFYRQYAFNPYLFNAGYVGINNTIEASMAYRQQWSNFKDSPVTAGVSLQLPASDRVAIGFNMFTDKQVMVHNSNFIATFGYVVPIAKNQSLRFGLSGGVGVNKLDLTAEEMGSNDHVIARSAGASYYVDGNFGMVYTRDGLRLGFALTDIFKSNAFNAETFNKFQMSNLRNRLFSASYKFNVGVMQNIALEPYALYRQTTDGAQDYFEVATIAYYKQNIWTGVSYNQNKGIALILGANVKEKFRFSYSYDFPSFNSAMKSGSSHEIHFGIRIAGKKAKAYVKAQEARELANEQKKAQSVDNDAVVLEDANQPVTNDIAAIHEENKANSGNDAVNKNTGATEAVKTPANSTKTASPKMRESFAMSKGQNYVVVGAFKMMSGSMRYVKYLKAKGYSASVALNPKKNLYYVYISSSSDASEARKARNEYRRKNLFKEAWVFTMD
ncbi:MAG TPA: PorP/SprF family type IX secretion system membrane protein [Chryseolinea sp.]|nr:PorP/SprF family type IX secretion system membrane protein [Chryseolinea sp.]